MKATFEEEDRQPTIKPKRDIAKIILLVSAFSLLIGSIVFIVIDWDGTNFQFDITKTIEEIASSDKEDIRDNTEDLSVDKEAEIKYDEGTLELSGMNKYAAYFYDGYILEIGIMNGSFEKTFTAVAVKITYLDDDDVEIGNEYIIIDVVFEPWTWKDFEIVADNYPSADYVKFEIINTKSR